MHLWALATMMLAMRCCMPHIWSRLRFHSHSLSWPHSPATPTLTHLQHHNHNKHKPQTHTHARPHYSTPPRTRTSTTPKPSSYISTESHGYPHAPGIFTEHQVNAWRRVTDAVHCKGGKIVCQLWHIGRVSHKSWVEHPLCKALADVWQPGVSASAIAIPGQKVRQPKRYRGKPAN
jgi:2,4-dienoyl-CoA reductase-like NADH-dependent reductase (Old Yellow Enzyme family)